MKAIASLKERSPLSRGGRGFAALLFLGLGVLALFAGIEPVWAKWAVVTAAAIGLLTVSLWKAPAKDCAVSEEEIIEIARRAIRTEATRLDAKRQGLEKVLMAYGEWMEFPDFKTLQTIDWKDEDHVAMDSRVAALLDIEADLMLQRFSSGVYWTSGKFEGKQLLLDLASFTEAIARIYRPESDLPLLELNLESLFKAVNRASLQIILLIEELPILEVKEMNLRNGFREHPQGEQGLPEV